MKNLRAFVLCLFPIVLAGLAAEGCKKDTTVAPPPKQEPKDPRTYTWTIDTLQHPESFQTMMMRIWGSDPKNVYVVGHNDVGKRKMYHYNGERWEVVPLTQNEGGPIERPNLSDIFGFGPSNIYAVGDRPIANPNPPPNTIFASLIIRFDGAQWRDIPTSGLFLQAIAGNSSGLAYAAGGGNVGFVITGSMVTPDTIPNTSSGSAVFQVNTVAVTSTGEVYANGTTRDNFSSKFHFLYRPSSGEWRILDSAIIQPGLVENKWGYAKFWYSTWARLYSVYGGVFTWNGSAWNKILDSETALSDVKGRSDNDLFVCGHFGLLYHFNGHDWFQFQQFANPDLVLTALLVFQDDIFLLGHQAGGYRTLIFHGK